MAEIIPAIMPKTLHDLEEHCQKVVGSVDTVQIDVMDGKFVAVRTWPYNRHDDFFDAILREEQALPMWEELDYEVDLMVANPEREAQTWITAGAKRVIAHIESITDMKSFLALASEFVEVGLAIGNDTPLDTILPYLKSIDCVQCMGIAKIGFQGQPFDRRVLERIKALRVADPELPISVDGAVTIDTAPLLIEAGADILVSGSFVFDGESPVEAIHRLENV